MNSIPSDFLILACLRIMPRMIVSRNFVLDTAIGMLLQPRTHSLALCRGAVLVKPGVILHIHPFTSPKQPMCMHTRPSTAVAQKHPGDREKLARMSLIEGLFNAYYMSPSIQPTSDLSIGLPPLPPLSSFPSLRMYPMCLLLCYLTVSWLCASFMRTNNLLISSQYYHALNLVTNVSPTSLLLLLTYTIH